MKDLKHAEGLQQKRDKRRVERENREYQINYAAQIEEARRANEAVRLQRDLRKFQRNRRAIVIQRAFRRKNIQGLQQNGLLVFNLPENITECVRSVRNQPEEIDRTRTKQGQRISFHYFCEKPKHCIYERQHQ